MQLSFIPDLPPRLSRPKLVSPRRGFSLYSTRRPRSSRMEIG